MQEFRDLPSPHTGSVGAAEMQQPAAATQQPDNTGQVTAPMSSDACEVDACRALCPPLGLKKWQRDACLLHDAMQLYVAWRAAY